MKLHFLAFLMEMAGRRRYIFLQLWHMHIALGPWSLYKLTSGSLKNCKITYLWLIHFFITISGSGYAWKTATFSALQKRRKLNFSREVCYILMIRNKKGFIQIFLNIVSFLVDMHSTTPYQLGILHRLVSIHSFIFW